MRQSLILTTALFCLAVVAQLSTSADEAKEPKDAAKDKSSEWKDGSAWEGIDKWRTANGSEGSANVTYEVTKRDGKSFEGRLKIGDDEQIFEFEGKADVTGEINLTITKIAKAPDAYKKGFGRNRVGNKQSGQIDGMSLTLKEIHHDPDHPKGAATIHTFKLKLKEDQ